MLAEPPPGNPKRRRPDGWLRRRRLVSLCRGPGILVLLAAALLGQTEEFSFIHASDTHAPLAGAAEVFATLKDGHELVLEPFGLSAPRPSFMVVTGDLTEFGEHGGADSAYARYRDAATSTGLEVHDVLGNHDTTWGSLRPRLRAHGQTPNRWFQKHGCVFVILDSSTPQDPRPSFGAEDLRWLRAEVAKMPPEAPVFLFCHHPPDGTEFASARERNQLLDLLDGRRLAAWFVGHYHSAFHARVDGVDLIGGGSTLPKNPAHRGYNIVSVKDGRLRVAFRRFGDPATLVPLLDKSLVEPWHQPLLVESPEPGEALTERGLRLRARLACDEAELTAGAVVEGADLAVPLTVTRKPGGIALLEGTLEARLAPGDHLLRFEIRAKGGEVFSRAVPIVVPESDGAITTRWRIELKGGVRGIARSGATLAIAGADGAVHLLDRDTGTLRASENLGSEVLGRPCVLNGRFFAASADGRVVGLPNGREKRLSTDVGFPIASPPVACGGRIVVFGTNGAVAAIDPRSGAVTTTASVASGAFDSGITVEGDRVYAGAWDDHLYALRGTEGGLVVAWRARTAGPGASSPGAARYFSPADAPAIASGGRVFVADRSSTLSVLDAASGKLAGTLENAVAIAEGPRPGTVVVRRKDDSVALVEGTKVLWTLALPTGACPVPPVAVGDGRYLVVSDRGDLSIFRPLSDEPVVRRRVFTGGYLLATPLVDGDLIVVGALDGTVTALGLPPGPR